MGWLSTFFRGRNRSGADQGQSEGKKDYRERPSRGGEGTIVEDMSGSRAGAREGRSSSPPVVAEQPKPRHSDTSLSVNTRFIVVELQQGTREWLEWRHKGIGASDAPTIMGENPFESVEELLREKRGPVRASTESEAMARGKRLEPEARKRYIARTGIDVRPACIQSTRYDWLRASLDGLSTSHDAVVEIKCGDSVYRKVSASRSVPDYYYGQTQHILAVTGFDSLDFWCYWPGCPELLVRVQRDDAYIERLLNRELEFWDRIRRNT